MHTHHKIPKHAGGTDDPLNLVELTIEEHAEAHRKLYEQYSRWQDYVAWKGLVGLITAEERMIIMYEARKGSGNPMYGKPCTYKMSDEEKLQWKSNIGNSLKGKKQTLEHIKKRMPWKGDGTKNPMYGKTAWNKGKKTGPASLKSKMKKGRALIYNGVQYYGIKEAARANGTTEYYIKQSCKFLD